MIHEQKYLCFKTFLKKVHESIESFPKKNAVNLSLKVHLEKSLAHIFDPENTLQTVFSNSVFLQKISLKYRKIVSTPGLRYRVLFCLLTEYRAEFKNEIRATI